MEKLGVVAPQSQHLGRQKTERQADLCEVRPVWSTQRVPSQPGLLNDILSKLQNEYIKKKKKDCQNQVPIWRPTNGYWVEVVKKKTLQAGPWPERPLTCLLRIRSPMHYPLLCHQLSQNLTTHHNRHFSVSVAGTD